MKLTITERMNRTRDETGRAQPDQIKDRIDEASDESFPASDPPAWGPLLARPPAQASKENDSTSKDEEGLHETNLRRVQVLEGLVLVMFMLGLVLYLSVFCWFLAGI